MTLANLRILARAMIPGAKITVINSPTLDLILNEGVKDIAAHTCCLKANKNFNAVADQSEYALSVVLGDYLAVDKPGLWWYNGTQWRHVYPRTLKWLDDNQPTWRNLSSGSPRYYSIDADILTISPPPETAGTDYFRLYYGKRPTIMVSTDSYPFSGTTTELTHLAIFDMAIIKYAKWVIEPMMNKDIDANISLREYKSEREEKLNQLNKRRDIAADTEARLTGPKPC